MSGSGGLVGRAAMAGPGVGLLRARGSGRPVVSVRRSNSTVVLIVGVHNRGRLIVDV